MYNLIEYIDNYAKTCRNLPKHYKDIPAVNNNGEIVDFDLDNLSDSFGFKEKITGQTGDNVTGEVEIMGSIDNSLPIELLIFYNSRK